MEMKPLKISLGQTCFINLSRSIFITLPEWRKWSEKCHQKFNREFQGDGNGISVIFRYEMEILFFMFKSRAPHGPIQRRKDIQRLTENLIIFWQRKWRASNFPVKLILRFFGAGTI
jgi:hypothetical protein